MSHSRFGSLKRLFSADALSLFSGSFRYLRTKISRSDVIWFLGLSLAILLAVLVRILPLSWGFTLSEFDPFFHYDVTRYVAEHGYQAWFTTPSSEWVKYWYPYGRNIPTTSFPGLPFTSATLYYFVSALGFSVSVLDVCIVFPVVMGALTCIVGYFFGKDIGGKGAGLFFSLFLALNPAYISRTALGFFDDETVGIFGMLLLFLFYLRSLQPEKRRFVRVGYAIAAGLSLGYVCASWGAARYFFGLLPLFTFILLFSKKYSQNLLLSYSTVMGVGLLIAASVPKLGFNYLVEFEVIAAFGVFLLLSLVEIMRSFETRKTKAVFAVFFFAVLGLAFYVALQSGLITLPAGRYISVLNPFERLFMPLIESVQEHRPATWSILYYQFGFLIFLAPLGLYLASRKPTNHNIFLIVFTLTALYFTSSMVRLALILAPALCGLGALAMVEIMHSFLEVSEKQTYTRRRARFAPHVGRGFSWSFFACLFLLATFTLTRGVESAYTPTTIATSSLPVRANLYDWEEALIWMREGLPNNAVVAAWWDYGYWITVGGNKTSLADNGTLNTTQIAQIGRMFMSNETQALAILKQYNVTHVVVFSTISVAISAKQSIFYGDEVKWYWMAEIGGLNSTKLQDTTITDRLDTLLSTSAFSGMYLPKADTVLTKLMIYGALEVLSSTRAPPDAYTLQYSYGLPDIVPQSFKLVFSSSNSMVFIYEVRY
jgi:dolichyl-diphosphooligosaccharide--protein glycosyltransferase